MSKPVPCSFSCVLQRALLASYLLLLLVPWYRCYHDTWRLYQFEIISPRLKDDFVPFICHLVILVNCTVRCLFHSSTRICPLHETCGHMVSHRRWTTLWSLVHWPNVLIIAFYNYVLSTVTWRPGAETWRRTHSINNSAADSLKKWNVLNSGIRKNVLTLYNLIADNTNDAFCAAVYWTYLCILWPVNIDGLLSLLPASADVLQPDEQLPSDGAAAVIFERSGSVGLCSACHCRIFFFRW